MPEPVDELQPEVADYDPEEVVDSVAAKRFTTLFLLGVGALVLFFVWASYIAPGQFFKDSPITPLEAEQLRVSMGLVDSAMKVEERLGNQVIREAEPVPPNPADFSQTVTLTVIKPSGEETVYKLQYGFASLSGFEGAERVLEIHPLNQNAVTLLDDWHIAYVAPTEALSD